MLCEKCGISNPQNVGVCCGCGAPMPPRSMCAGFADILTYESAPAAPAAPPVPTAVPPMAPPMPPANQGYYPEPPIYSGNPGSRGSFFDRNSRTLLGALAAICVLLLIFLVITLIGRATDAARIEELNTLLSASDKGNDNDALWEENPEDTSSTDVDNPTSPSDAGTGEEEPPPETDPVDDEDDDFDEEKTASGEGDNPVETTTATRAQGQNGGKITTRKTTTTTKNTTTTTTKATTPAPTAPTFVADPDKQ
ncbi:MAG: hypothetical protein E7554_04445 [Ruminococcaceae bacterium]|nr:hypothetical protein [Oscillospiraceae bacterium]